jgi:beta-galactosidase/beta-glucuronidase
VRAIVAALLLFLAGASAPSAPPKAVERTSLSLNGPWSFRLDSRRDWARVDVPHTWNVVPAYRDYEGVAWYRRTFALPRVSGARVTLRFGAVFYEARVWVNGVDVGRHEGGYTPFELDVTKAARPGRSNVVLVRVDNRRARDRIPAQLTPNWSFDWWNYGGIVRDVAVQLTSRVYVAHERVVATPELSGEDRAASAAVETILRIRNATGRRFEGIATAAVDSVTASKPIVVEQGESRSFRLRLSLEAPRLWHFDHPELYRLTTSVTDARGRIFDRLTTSFGVRSVELRDARLLLNGEPVRLVGLTRHSDSPANGLAEPLDVVDDDYDDLKRLNEVLTRPAHYPQSEAVLDYADRHGILLIPEVPAWQLLADQLGDPGLQALHRAQLRELVASELNHPSVIAWSVANEIESDTREGYDFVRKAIATVKALDPTRPVGFASNRLNSSPATDATRFADFVMMNEYFGTWAGPKEGLGAALDRVHEAFPAKPVIVSEFGFEPRWQQLVGRQTSTLDPASYYVVANSVPPGSDRADAQRRALIAEQMNVFRQRPFVVGAIFWTYQDYRTRTNFIMGVVDADRRRRGSWSRIRAEYAPAHLSSFSFVPGGARVALRTRADLPGYTLRGYTLHWATETEEGTLPLPPLAPGSTWSGDVMWRVTPSRVRLALVRPTGYAAFEETFERVADRKR